MKGCFLRRGSLMRRWRYAGTGKSTGIVLWMSPQVPQLYGRPGGAGMLFLREKRMTSVSRMPPGIKLYRRELMGELRFPKGKYYEDIVYTTKLLARASGTIYMDFSFYNYVLEREGSIMGEGLGERIFTDQLPAYEEKEAFAFHRQNGFGGYPSIFFL